MPAAPPQNDVGSEAQLLLRLCSRSIDDTFTPVAPNWDHVLRLAERHRVTPLVYSNLKRLDPSFVPPHVMSELRGAVQANAGRVLQLAGELRRLLVEFEQAEIPVIPFKGIVLAATVYGDLSLRDAGDVDLLVRHDDIVKAVDLLVSLGHQPMYPTATPQETAYLSSLSGKRREWYLRWHCEHHLVYAPTRLNVDLHWAMSLREFAVSVDTDGMWRRARPAMVAGREVLALCPEDLLIVLCLNGAKDYWRRIDRICDLGELLHREESIDWEQVFAQAIRSGWARMLRVGLLLAVRLLATPLPPDVLARVNSDAKAARIACEIGARLCDADPVEPTRVRRALFDLRMRDRWRDRLRYCAAHLRPGVGDWAAVRLPASLAFLHYVIRPFRLVGRHV